MDNIISTTNMKLKKKTFIPTVLCIQSISNTAIKFKIKFQLQFTSSLLLNIKLVKPISQLGTLFSKTKSMHLSGSNLNTMTPEN
jgi:hypothetical protein